MIMREADEAASVVTVCIFIVALFWYGMAPAAAPVEAGPKMVCQLLQRYEINAGDGSAPKLWQTECGPGARLVAVPVTTPMRNISFLPNRMFNPDNLTVVGYACCWDTP